ncbi:MAG: 50S ribosomal protein L25/general stress protein Ctc [Actinomycetota bacterium]|nr:50S ribosomal protein L25/general stress protein Ctc [Actinomycetota bacterium]
MSELQLSAERRTDFGKGGARRTRRAGRIPAVLYGHGADPQHLALPAQEFTLAVRRGGANVLLTLDIEGTQALAIPKAIQRHAIRGTFDHVDLLAVRRGEKVTIDVALDITGDVVPGGLLQQETTSLSVEAEATHIPTEFAVDIAELEIGAQLTAADVRLPDGVSLIGDPEQIVLIISEAPTAEQIDAEVAESAAELGIQEDRPAAEAEESPEGGVDSGSGAPSGAE